MSPLTRVLHSLPPIIWLALVWCALWQDFTLPFLAFGLVLSLLVVLVFRLPTLYLSNRFNLWFALVFVVNFLWQIAVASVQLTWLALTFRKPLKNSIVSVKLRTKSDLYLTAVSHTLSLIPGSLVVDVDRSQSILYFHVLNASTAADIARFRKQALDVEARILRAVGTSEEYRALREEEYLAADLQARGGH